MGIFDKAKDLLSGNKDKAVEGIEKAAAVADEKTGNVANWALEMGGPNALLRLGWKRDSLKTDDVITVEGSLARDGSNLVNARAIMMTNSGKKMLAGSSGGAETAAAPAAR